MNSEQAVVAASIATVKMVLLDEIRVSKTNPRKRFDPDALAELQGSIKEKGLVSPLLVRPVSAAEDPADHTVKMFELVAGERRFRCCRALGVDQVPCLVRELTDQQALELQVIENLQRDDLDLLEEAEGYEMLLASGEYSAKDLASKLNKTPNYIYQRLKLLFLPAPARQALLDGKLTFGNARQIACLPHEDWRNEATSIVLNPRSSKVPGLQNYFWNHPENEPLTATQTTALLTSRYMRELKTAPFDQKNATLVPEAGPCTTCPKRAGNSPDLFPQLRADICTDLKCFAAKQEAVRLGIVAEAAAAGQRVLSKEETSKVIEDDGDSKHDSEYVKLDEEPSWSELVPGAQTRPKWSKLIKGQDVPVVLAIDATGRVHKMVERKLAVVAGKANKPEIFRSRETSMGSDSAKKEAEKRKKEAALQKEIASDAIDYLVVAIEKSNPPGPTFANALCAFATRQADEETYGFDYWERICTRRRLDLKTKMADYTVKLGTPAAKFAFTVEILLTAGEYTIEDAEFKIWLTTYKIDTAKIIRNVKAALAERESQAVVANLKKQFEAAAAKKASKLAKGKSATGPVKSPTPVKVYAAKSVGAEVAAVLLAAGTTGITVKEIAAKTKKKPGAIFAWFFTTGKKDGNICKVGEAKYAYRASVFEKAGTK